MKAMTKTGWVRSLYDIPYLEMPTELLEIGQAVYCSKMDGETLVVDFYYRDSKAPTARAFLHPTFEWASQNGKGLITTATLAHAFPYYLWHRNIQPVVQEDADLINKYFGGTGGCREINKYQSAVLAARLEEKHNKIRRRIDEKMRTVGDLPHGFYEWVFDKVFEPYRYIYYDYTGKKLQTGKCTYCGDTVQLQGMKHNREGVCPSCDSKVIFKSAKKAAPLFFEHLVGVFVRSSEGLWVMRTYNAIRRVRKYGGVEDTIGEVVRDFYDTNLKALENYTWGNFRQSGTITWGEAKNGSSYCNAYIYPHNLDEVLINRPYTGLKEFAISCKAPTRVVDFLTQAQRHPELEYIVKQGLFSAAATMVRAQSFKSGQKTKNLAEYFGLNQEQLRWAKEKDLRYNYIQLMARFNKENIKINKRELEYLIHADLEYSTSLLIPCLKYARLEKMLNYLKKQSGVYSMCRKLEVFRDHTSMLEQMRYPINDFTLYPKNLFEAHAKIMKEFNLKEDEKKSKKLKKLSSALEKQFALECEGYKIVTPHSLADLRDEGAYLHHCVASYADRMLEGKTVVLFIRKVDDPETPFATMEIAENRIRQVRGKNNQDLKDALKKFLREFKKQKEVA